MKAGQTVTLLLTAPFCCIKSYDTGIQSAELLKLKVILADDNLLSVEEVAVASSV
jgi:hypothetical protein